MKKKKLSVEVINKIAVVKRQVINTLSGDASELRDALLALFDELANQEEELDINQFKSEIEKIVAEYSDVPEATANAIAKATENVLKRINSFMPADSQLTPKVKNEIVSAIFRSRDKINVQDNIEAVLVKNGITGLSFDGLTDYVITWKVADLNPLFAKLHPTMFTKFFYGEIDIKNAAQAAAQWDRTLANNSGAEKVIQQLTASAKKITTDYIYKRQQFALADLDDIEAAGQLTEFLAMVSKELDTMIVNATVMTILIGDKAHGGSDRITTFEEIGTKMASDSFTTVIYQNNGNLAQYLNEVGVTPSTPQPSVRMATLQYVRNCIYNPQGKEVVAIMSRNTFNTLTPRLLASGGDFVFRTKEEVASELGVDDIILLDIMPDWHNPSSVIFMIPDGYHYKEVKTLDVAYPSYEKNVQNIQKERNMGGAIHDLYSTAVYHGVDE